MRKRNELWNQASHETGVIYMTKDDYDSLKEQLLIKKQELDEASKSIWEATQQSSETWHDNAPFDIAVEKTDFLNKQYIQLLRTFERAVVIQTPSNTEKIVLWTKVDLLINFDIKQTYVLSGISDLKNSKISVSSPLWQSILWRQEWDETQYFVWNKAINVKILKILQ